MITSADLETESKSRVDLPGDGLGTTGSDLGNLPRVKARTEAAGSHTPVGRQMLRFLVIEDMAELADLVVECLKALGFEAEIASTGEAALRLLSDGAYDVALVDIDLPDTTGFEVVAFANASGWLRSTRVVFCTGSRSEEYRQKAARYTGCRFLWKPFTLQDLMRCIEELPAAPGLKTLHGAGASPSDQMVANEMRL